MTTLIEYFSQLGAELQKLFLALSNTTSLFFWVLVLLVTLVIVLEAVSTLARKKRGVSGIEPEIKSILEPSHIFKETREYISDVQLLSAKPDALLVEGGYIIPVERKINANKIRDRFVVELLISMRLIAELEGKRPPYGYLILGRKARRVKILNTQKRQEWLDGYLHQMRQILEANVAPRATPDHKKCPKCIVRVHCKSKILSNLGS